MMQFGKVSLAVRRQSDLAEPLARPPRIDDGGDECTDGAEWIASAGVTETCGAMSGRPARPPDM